MKRISNEDAIKPIANFEDFKSNTGTLHGNGMTWRDDSGIYQGYYVVYSYDTVMARFSLDNGSWSLKEYNDKKYSRTTSKHQAIILAAIKAASL